MNVYPIISVSHWMQLLCVTAKGDDDGKPRFWWHQLMSRCGGKESGLSCQGVNHRIVLCGARDEQRAGLQWLQWLQWLHVVTPNTW